MCNGLVANSTIETCNSCNCFEDGWMDRHRREHPDQPLIFTENEGYVQNWGDATAIRTASAQAYSAAEWFAAGGAYHSYYMWYGGNNYGRTAASGIATLYMDDAPLHADGTLNEPKYTQLGRLQHLVANHSDINSVNTELFPVVIGPLEWRTWSEPSVSNLPVITSPNPIEQLLITNDQTIYLWYRHNVTLTETSSHTLVTVETRKANALLFFLDGEYLGEFDNHDSARGSLTATIALDLSTFKLNQKYLFEILSISLGVDKVYAQNSFEYKGIVGNVWLGGQLLTNDTINLWEHQSGLVGEHFQIYTERGSSKVDWNTEWTIGINRPITWFQARFDLDHLVQEDLNANPVLLDAQGLKRGHAFINGNDLGLYWLIQNLCHDKTPCCCQQAQINCLKPTQRYYHIPSDWLMAKNNLITVFNDLGASSPGSVGLVQRIVTI